MKFNIIPYCLIFFIISCNDTKREMGVGFSYSCAEVSENDQNLLKNKCGSNYFNPYGTGILKATLKNYSYDTIFVDLSFQVCDSIYALDYDQSNEYKVIQKDSVVFYGMALRFLNKAQKRIFILKNKAKDFFVFVYKNTYYDSFFSEGVYSLKADSGGHKTTLHFNVLYPFHLKDIKKSPIYTY